MGIPNISQLYDTYIYVAYGHHKIKNRIVRLRGILTWKGDHQLMFSWLQ